MDSKPRRAWLDASPLVSLPLLHLICKPLPDDPLKPDTVRTSHGNFSVYLLLSLAGMLTLSHSHSFCPCVSQTSSMVDAAQLSLTSHFLQDKAILALPSILQSGTLGLAVPPTYSHFPHAEVSCAHIQARSQPLALIPLLSPC